VWNQRGYPGFAARQKKLGRIACAKCQKDNCTHIGSGDAVGCGGVEAVIDPSQGDDL